MNRDEVFDCIYGCTRCTGTVTSSKTMYCMICRDWAEVATIKGVVISTPEALLEEDDDII